MRRWLVPLAIGACAAACAYAASRALQAVFFPMPDPRTVLAAQRIAFYWRAWIALYVATLATIGAAALRARAPERFDRALPAMVGFTAITTTLQGVLLP